MFWLVLGMTLTVALAAFVVAIVAVPARRAGRPLLTARGEKIFHVGDTPAPPRSEQQGEAGVSSKRRRLRRRS